MVGDSRLHPQTSSRPTLGYTFALEESTPRHHVYPRQPQHTEAFLRKS